mgnify:CR=1 FL=1
MKERCAGHNLQRRRRNAASALLLLALAAALAVWLVWGVRVYQHAKKN